MPYHRTIAMPGVTRTALFLRGELLVALGVIFARLLVRDTHDNAYLVPALAGQVLPVLAVPFVVAALLPVGKARRIGAWVAVALVWGVGGLLAVVFLCYAVLLIGASLLARRFPWSAVTVVHVVGAVLLVPTVFGINHRLFR